jgi:hypothetical protein
MTYLIDDPEAAKLIERRPDPADRRAHGPESAPRVGPVHLRWNAAVNYSSKVCEPPEICRTYGIQTFVFPAFWAGFEYA